MALRSDHDRCGGQKHERRLADEGVPAGLAHPPPGHGLPPDSAVYQYGLSCNPLFKGAQPPLWGLESHCQSAIIRTRLTVS